MEKIKYERVVFEGSQKEIDFTQTLVRRHVGLEPKYRGEIKKE
jgi:hypothetical protein